jgi:carotenoid cleavage dioxygenase-like enzyme
MEGFSFIHDFGVSEKFYFFIRTPLTIDILPVLLGTKVFAFFFTTFFIIWKN